MVSATSVVLALALAAGAHASVSTKIAGYYPGSDVEDHNDVDISGKALSNFLKGENYDGTDLGTGAAGIKYTLATSMYAGGAGGSSQKVKYTVTGVSAALTPEMIVEQTATSVSSVWGFDNQVTGLRDTTGVASGDTRSNSYTCAEDTDDDGTTDIPLGKMALKKGFIGAHPQTGKALKVYMSDGWSTKECGQVPFRDAVSGTCPGTTYTAGDACGDQYKDASCPGGGVAKSSTTVKIKCTASATTWAKDITYIANGATTYGQRTLKGFSTAVQAKMITGPSRAEPEAVAVKAFHKVPSYGDMTISAALEALTASASSFSTCTAPNAGNDKIDAVGCTGTWAQGTAICKHKDTRDPMINIAGATYALKKTACETAGGKVTDFFLYKADGSGAADKKKLTIETIQKMAVYTNAWLYTIHEFEDAIADCEAATLHDNDEGVHAWDEGVAFYTGSNAGEAGGSEAGAKKGNMIYALANKRCKNFKTCGVGEFSGNSAVNIALFDQFAGGMNACQVGNCVKAQGHLDKIIPLMSVPLIQGTLRYAYKVAVLQDAYKGFGEGYAFMMSVIHRVHFCSAADAKIIYEALDIPDVDPGTTGFKLGGTATAVDAAAPGKGIAAFTVVKEAFERNYDCMGITCADVGALHDDNKLAMEGAEVCGASASASATGTNTVTEKDVLPTWAIIAIAGAGALVVLFFGMMCAYKSSKDMTIKMYNDLKKEGAVGKV